MKVKEEKETAARKKTTLLLTLLIVVLLASLLFCLYRIYVLEKEDETYATDLEEMSAVRPAILGSSDETEEENSGADSDAEDGVKDGTKGYLSDALAVNPDTVAWIYIPDTEIDFPVMQTEDNEYYLRHSFTGLYSVYGCPFLDMRNNADFSDFVSIIYGHNTVTEYVFAPILEFTDQEYLMEHDTGLLIGDDVLYQVNFFACSVTDSYSDIYTVAFTSKTQKQEYIAEIENTAVSFLSADEDELISGQLLLLSTCSEEYENARTVLIGSLEEIGEEEAQRILAGETEDETLGAEMDTESEMGTESESRNEAESGTESKTGTESEPSTESENQTEPDDGIDADNDENAENEGDAPQISYTEPEDLGERIIVRDESFLDGTYVTIYQYEQYLNIHTAVFTGSAQDESTVSEILESYVGYELMNLELEKNDEKSKEYGCSYWETSFKVEAYDGTYYYYGAYLQYGSWDVLFLASVPEGALGIAGAYAEECADSLEVDVP